jgi:NitT/TauT family transport system substrate-binding protein
MAKPVIKIGHLKITDHLALGLTADKVQKGVETFKYFDLETKPYRGWNPLAEELRGGQLDGACILAPIAMELFHSGKKFNMVLQMHKEGSTIVVNKRANIQKLEDFKGKGVLIPHYLSMHHMLFDKLLRDSGLEIGPGKDLVFDVVAPAEIPEIMEWDEKGTVGGFIVAEPFGTQVIKEGYGTEFKLSKEIWPKHPCCILVLKTEVIDSNPDAVHELVNSLVASGKSVRLNVDHAIEVGSAFLGQNAEVMRTVLTDPREKVIYNEMMPALHDLDIMQNYMTGPIQAMSGKIDLEKFVDIQFARAAGAK